MHRFFLAVLAVAVVAGAETPAWLAEDSIYKTNHFFTFTDLSKVILDSDQIKDGNFIPLWTTQSVGTLVESLSFTPSYSVIFGGGIIKPLMTVSHFDYEHPSLDSMEIHIAQKPIVKKTKDGWVITFQKKGDRSCIFSWLY